MTTGLVHRRSSRGTFCSSNQTEYLKGKIVRMRSRVTWLSLAQPLWKDRPQAALTVRLRPKYYPVSNPFSSSIKTTERRIHISRPDCDSECWRFKSSAPKVFSRHSASLSPTSEAGDISALLTAIENVERQIYCLAARG
jgi:hypothetical protein